MFKLSLSKPGSRKRHRGTPAYIATNLKLKGCIAVNKKDDSAVSETFELPPEWLFAWGKVSRVGGTEQRMADAIPVLSRHAINVSTLVRDIRRQTAFQKLMRSRTEKLLHAPSWAEFYRAVRNFKGSAIWVFGFKQSLIARFVKLIHSVPWTLVMARNGLDYTWKPWMHWVDRLTQKQIDLYVTNSGRVSQHLVTQGIDTQRVEVVRSGLPEYWYENVSDTMNTDFLMVGNNRPQKNQLRGLEAFLESRVPTTLTIYTNDGTLIRNRLEELGDEARKRVNVVEGHRLTPQDFDSFGVLLHPSISESLPLTILEAQARGCFVLAADTGDTAHLVDDTNGLLINPYSIQEMSSKIISAFEIVAKRHTRLSITTRTVPNYVADILHVVERRQK